MARLLALVHTVRSVMPSIESLAADVLGPAVERLHIVDDLLLHDLLAHHAITPFVHRHFAHHAAEAEELGASAVLLTCSSIAPCVDTAAPAVRIPVLRIDEAMVDRALTLGRRIGILATIDLALDAVYDLTRRTAEGCGKTAEIEPVLCRAEAYAAMLAGRREKHDRIVRESLRQLAGHSDVVLLAQGSMATAVEEMDLAALGVPVLSGPRLALERVKEVMGGVAE